MRPTLLLPFLSLPTLLGCHHPTPPPAHPTPQTLHEVRDPAGNVIERDALSESEPLPPDVPEIIPPKPYPTALYIRGYWYQDRPHPRWIWIKGYWR